MRRVGTYTLLPIALLLAASCAPDSTVDSTSGPLQVPEGPAFALQETVDNCNNCCHDNVATSGDANYYCPQWCHTYPLTSALRQRITNAMGYINPVQCAWARGFIQTMLNNGAIRYYHEDLYSSVGDWHSSRPFDDGQGPDYGGKMHLEYDLTYDLRYLAETLVHEAYHGFYNSSNQEAAELAAQNCTGSFSF